MIRKIALALSAAAVIALPAAAEARDRHGDGNGRHWNGDRDGRHWNGRHSGYRYSGYRYAYPR